MAGSDYYAEGVTSKSMGDFVTGGSLISVGSWTSKTEIININGEVVDDDSPDVKEVVGPFGPCLMRGAKKLPFFCIPFKTFPYLCRREREMNGNETAR